MKKSTVVRKTAENLWEDLGRFPLQGTDVEERFIAVASTRLEQLERTVRHRALLDIIPDLCKMCDGKGKGGGIGSLPVRDTTTYLQLMWWHKPTDGYRGPWIPCDAWVVWERIRQAST